MALSKGYGTFRTQKARGVNYLRNKGGAFGLRFGTGSNYGLTIFPSEPIPTTLPVFARPCPKMPRHGFVDSREVKSFQEVAEVIAETFAADPEAEIIFMPKLSGAWSAVATPFSVAIGDGNDGVTSGKKTAFTIPTAPANVGAHQHWLFEALGDIEYSTVSEGETAFVEAVEHHEQLRLVQSRLGPIVKGATNFIPKEMEVSTVFVGPVDMDLLGWEKLVAQFEPGTVVYWPGGGLTSHYAIHCVQKGVPFITQGPLPKKGQKLEKEGAPKTSKHGRDLFLKEIKKLLANPPARNHKSNVDVDLAMAIAHSHSLWPNTSMFAKLRALGLYNLLRYGAAACVGEARHFYTSGPGRAKLEGKPESRPSRLRLREHGIDPCAESAEGITFDRQSVYEWVFGQPLKEAVKLCGLAKHDLASPGWKKSVGGSKWKHSAAAVVNLWARLQAFIASPTAARWGHLVSAWNVAANSVHNNGCFINKWSCIIAHVCTLPAWGFLYHAGEVRKLVLNWQAQEKAEKEAEAAAKAAAQAAQNEPQAEAWPGQTTATAYGIGG